MKKFGRRTFITTAAAAVGAGLTARFSPSAWARPPGSNDAVRLAVVGINSKGASLIRQALDTPGARVTALCDVDPRILAREVEKLKDQKIPVFATTDVRELLDRSDVDALVIASSNHWHALQTIWACQAGKDVYVEKPVSHTVWSGRRMIEAAARYGRIVQAGTQSRSDTGLPEAFAYLREGHLGKMLWIHALDYKLRNPIGKRKPWYPDWLSYDRYCGPAPVAPLRRNELHYDWHWMWDTGNGDLGNIGIHQVDIARWASGNPSIPRRVMSIGGRFLVDDAGETPNTQLTVFDYPNLPIIMENRGLPAEPGATFMDNLRGIRVGVIIQCEGGYFSGYRGGWIHDRDGTRLKQFRGDGGRGHLINFVEAVRSRRTSDLAAPIETGHISSSTCLFGNISYRIGKPAAAGKIRAALGGNSFLQDAFSGMSRHMGVHGLDTEKPILSLGPWLQLNSGTDGIDAIEGGDDAEPARARFLLRGAERPPYATPEQV